MKLVSVIAAGMIAAMLGGCASAPAPVDYRAVLTAPCPNASDETPWLTIAIWDDGDTYHMATRFEPSGAMPYAYENRGDESFDNGRWSIDGTNLAFDMNNHYADYTGTFNGTTGSGTMKNVAGNTGTWTMAAACDSQSG